VVDDDVVATAVGEAVTAGLAVAVAGVLDLSVKPLTSPTSAARLPTSVALRARAAGCRLRGLRRSIVEFMPRQSRIGLASP
jgi:hypothetical protein